LIVSGLICHDHNDSLDGERPARGHWLWRRPMTTKSDFTEEEWTRLERAPIIAGMAISLADPGGPIEAVKETMATIKTITETAQSGDGAELVDAVAKSFAEKTKKKENPLKDFKPKGAMAGQEILEELQAVNQIVTQKATPEEAAAFRQWLLTTAKRVADAAKEGGFMGFNAKRVSEGEQAMLDKLAEVLS
jgi:hypothetical protein